MYEYLIIIMLFMLWIYFINLSLENNDMGFSVFQFILAIPLQVFLANNSYVNGILFGYVFVFVILGASIYIVAHNYDIKTKIIKKR